MYQIGSDHHSSLMDMHKLLLVNIDLHFHILAYTKLKCRKSRGVIIVTYFIFLTVPVYNIIRGLPGHDIRMQGLVCTNQSESPLQLSSEIWLFPQNAVRDCNPLPQVVLQSDQLDHVIPRKYKKLICMSQNLQYRGSKQLRC